MSDMYDIWPYPPQDWWKTVGLLQTNEEYSIDQLEHCYQVHNCVVTLPTDVTSCIVNIVEMLQFSPTIHCMRYIFK